MRIERKTSEGATFVSLTNDIGFTLTLCDIGASIYQIEYLGKTMNVAPEDVARFLNNPGLYGKTVGPVAGRVKEGKIKVDGKDVTLPINDANNCAHSGYLGVQNKRFEILESEREGEACVEFRLHFEADEHYPTDAAISISYLLKENEAEFKIVSSFSPDKDAPGNLINHTYFSLNEEGVDSLKLYVDSKDVAHYDGDLIIEGSGEVDLITDFSELRPLARHIDDPKLMDNRLKGYDHCYYFSRFDLDKPKVILQGSDFALEIYTSAPAVQIYSDNYPLPDCTLLDGRKEKVHSGVAIEPCSYQGNPLAMEVKRGKTNVLTSIYHFVDRKAFEKENSPEKAVAGLIYFAKVHGLIEEADETYLHNMVLHHLKLLSPYQGELDYSHLRALCVPDEFLPPIKRRLEEIGFEASEAERELCFILGMISPRPSVVERGFAGIFDSSPLEATEYLYSLSLASGYVAKEKVDQNVVYDARFEDGPDLEISINLSKPEKNNKDIAKLLTQKSVGYPACVLCYENLGFGGSPTHAARGNIRFVPITLQGERWYLQFSPYGYFKRHCIVFSKEHKPMAMNREVFSCLFDFVDLFPHYFIGSNSDLPIVGGSILNHEHFQGGKAELPLLRAPFKKEFDSGIEGVKLFQVDFYDCALCIESKDREKAIELGEKIRRSWRNYDDEENEIVSFSDNANHNTVTPIVRKYGKTYRFFLILRNNRCNERYPGGIFHAHPEFAHIKQEGIGLIEASGLFILPARLLRQSKTLEECLANDVEFEQVKSRFPDLSGFEDMYGEMKRGVSKEDYMAGVCRKILGNVSVFKKDEKGQKGLERFLREVK